MASEPRVLWGPATLNVRGHTGEYRVVEKPGRDVLVIELNYVDDDGFDSYGSFGDLGSMIVSALVAERDALRTDAQLGRALREAREAWKDPYITTEYSETSKLWWVLSGNGGYMCADPEAAERRAKLGRCCVGGPCHKPAAAETELAALREALASAPVRESDG